jgi:hypothetical protein
MKVKIILTLFITGILLLNVYGNELDEKIKSEVELLSTILPSNSQSYIRSIQSTGDIKRTEFQIDDMETELNKLNLNGEARDKIKGIIFSTAATLQGFTLALDNNLGRLDNMVGLAKKTGKTISLILLNSNSWGNLVQQYSTITRKKCKKIVLFKKCENEHVSVPRGFLSSEIGIIETSLRYYSFMTFKNLIQKITGGLPYTKVQSNEIEFSEKEKFPAISFINDEFKDDPYLILLNNNLSSMYDKIVTFKQRFVKEEDLESILAEHISKGELLNFLKKSTDLFSSNNKRHHHIYRSLYTNEGSLNFIEVIIHVSDTEAYNRIEIRNLNLKMAYNDNILTVKYDDLINYVDVINNQDYQDELDIILYMMELLFEKKAIEDRVEANLKILLEK